MNTASIPVPFSAVELLEQIERDTSTCKALLALMEKEREALTTRDVETVETLIEQKVPLLNALESSAKQREQWARASSLGNHTESHWAKMLATLDRDDISKKWASLKELYNDVHTQNEINGKLLTRHQATLTRLLDIMKGKTVTPSLYSAQGYSSPSSYANQLGEA